MRTRTAVLISTLLLLSWPGLAAASASSDEMVTQALMKRFDISRSEVARQLAAQNLAVRNDERLSRKLGSRYAGSWYDSESRRLVVAVADGESLPAQSMDVSVVPVRRSLRELKKVQREVGKINSLARPDTLFHRTWIDFRGNQVVAETTPELEQVARDAMAAADLSFEAVRIELGKPAEPLSTLRMGQIWENPDFIAQGIPGTGRCSIGFAVEEGFITAAHCGRAGDRATSEFFGELFGSVIMSMLPAKEIRPRRSPPEYHNVNDVALVGLSGSIAAPELHLYPGVSQRYIIGSSDGTVGAWVCRYGFRTGGPHCGEILSYNNHIYYGTWWGKPAYVHNLVQVSACADHGDSGGPLVLHDPRKISPGYATAVGMLAAGGGGQTTCGWSTTASDTTYYSLVSSAITDLGVTLKTVTPL